MQDKYSSKKSHLPNTKLKNARMNKGWTQGVLAAMIELPDPRTIGRWERGENVTSLHYCQKLVEVFGMSMEELGLRSTEKVPAAPISQPGPFYNIPRLLTTLIGRDREITDICTLLTHSDTYLVTLFGTGGIGKTRLAYQVATQMRNYFTAGVCLVSLSAITDPVQVLPAIASELALRENAELPLLEQLKFFLFDKNLLLVLDNFEHVMAATPSIETLINACPHLKVLVTSRYKLKLQGGKNFPVSPLPLPDSITRPELETLEQNPSIALFIQCTQAHQATFQLTEQNAPAIAQLCVHLDGLPLAIELAASRMQLSSPQKLLMHLPHSLLTLKNDADTVPERQRTLHSLIKWSYDLLDIHEQWLFRHLAVFAGPTSLETIENFFSTSEQPLITIEDGVLSLMNKSLLKQPDLSYDDFRITMLETIREFGLDCLRHNRELEENQRSHAIYYLHVVEKAALYFKGPEENKWLQILEKERLDLSAALTWLLVQQESSLALRFCEAFGNFCGLRGYWSEEQRWLKAALALPQTPQNQKMRARVLRRAGHLAYRFRELPEARKLLEESISLSYVIEDQHNLAGALGTLGRVFNKEHDVTRASQLFLESVEAARASNNDWSIANALECLGNFLYSQGKNDEADACLAESLALSRKLQDKETIVRALNTLGEMNIAQKDRRPQATIYAQESLKLAQELESKPLIGLAFDSLGEIALRDGRHEQAKQYFTQSFDIARNLSDISALDNRKLKLIDIALLQHDSKTIHAFMAENHELLPLSTELIKMRARCQEYIENEN